MKESYEEDLANHSAANPTLTRGNSVGVAWVSGTHRPTIELRYHIIVRMPTHSCLGKATRWWAIWQARHRYGGV